MSKNNLQFWNSVEKTNPKHTKKVTAGARSLTAINAQQQIKNATEKWGMYGATWGLKDIELSYVNSLSNNQILAVAQAVFFYPEGSFEIGSSILVQSWVASKSYNRVDDDFLKKLETDMTTKSLSKLGFNADVFLGKYDDNKYVAQMKAEFAEVKDKKEIKIGTEGFKAVKKAFKDGKITREKIVSSYKVSDTVLEQIVK